MKLSREHIEALQDACLSESTKIIRYLEEEKRKQKTSNIIKLILAIIGAIGSIIAAVVGIIALL